MRALLPVRIPLFFLFIGLFLNLPAQKIQAFQPFSVIKPTAEQQQFLQPYLHDYTLFKADEKALATIRYQKAENLTLFIPFEGGLSVNLQTNTFLPPYFASGMITEKGKLPYLYQQGSYYKGKLQSPASFAQP